MPPKMRPAKAIILQHRTVKDVSEIFKERSLMT